MRKMTTLFLMLACNAHATCFKQAADKYHIDPDLIYVICKGESAFKVDAINSDNSDGSIDYGYCQINSWWLSRLADYGIDRNVLLTDPCANVMVSAWIIDQNFKTGGVNWNSIGAYNAGWTQENAGARRVYIEKVKSNLRKYKKSK